jgi:hypothetical protein
MAMTESRTTPVDWLLAAFNLIMAVLWATAVATSPVARWMLAAHLVAVALPWLLQRQQRLSTPVLWLRRTYPVLWLLAFWTEVDFLRRTLHVTANDVLMKAFDTSLFGVALHTEWMPAMPSLWVSEPLHFAYFAYYAAIILPLAALAIQRRTHALHEAEFRLMLTYSVCFIAYALFPVDGPHHLENMYIGRPADGFWYGIVHAVNDSGGSLGAAFPSSHAAGAITIAYVGSLFFSRPVAVLMWVHAGMVVLATCYTQYHYAIDSIAGLALALSLQAWVAPVLLRSGRPAAIALPAPRLPVLPASWAGVRAGTQP